MKTSILGVIAFSILATIAARANAVLCSSIYTDCLGGTKIVQKNCPDCPTSTPPKGTEGCSYIYTPCPDGSLGAYLKITITCGSCPGV